MKRELTILSGCIVFLVVIAAIFFAFAASKGGDLDASSKRFVDDNVPKIISTWSTDAILPKCSPRLLQQATKEQIQQLFTSLSTKLGAFKSYDGSKGDSRMNFNILGGSTVTTASYKANATFANGQVEIDVLLTRENDEWKFLGFHVNPKPQ